MRWDKVDARWEKRRNAQEGDVLEDGVTFVVEKWEVPGEDPLEVRVCTRKGHPMKDFCNTRETPKTSIVLHTTAGYGGFSTLMGGDGDGRKASAHFMLGRDGIPYLLVKTEYVAWHATWWNENSVGIEVDTICQLFKDGKNLHSEYGKKDVYCTTDDTNVYWDHPWPGREGARYWATWTEDQYRGCGRLIKALCHKHNIPRMVLPEPKRYEPFQKTDRAKFKGLCTHLQIDPSRRIDIGPFIDWDKLIRYGALEQGDCFNAPGYTPPTGPTVPTGSASGSGSGSGAASGAAAEPAEPAAPKGPPKKTPQGAEVLPPPVQVDKHTVKVSIGHKAGRIALTVRKPGDPAPVAPKPGDLPAVADSTKRDDFIRAALNFLGCPWKAGGKDPKEGVDGVGLVGLCLKRVGVLDDHKDLDAGQLYGMFPHEGGTADSVPADILPGDLAWFGQGDHDTDAQQHPMIFLGGGRVLGPIPDGGGHQGKVQVVHISEVPEHFAGWTHLDELGKKTEHTEHPGEPPAPDAEPITTALLPSAPAARYDALKAIVGKLKGKWESAKGKVNLVGVKNLHGRSQVTPAPDDWNDTLFASFLDDDGHKCSVELKASLNPGTDTARAKTWQLWEGSYSFKLEDGGTQTVDKGELPPEDGEPSASPAAASTQVTFAGKVLRPDGNVKAWFDAIGLGAPRLLDTAKDSGKAVAGEIEGDYAKTHIQLAGVDGSTVARPDNGTQLVWGGTGVSSPWGHLVALIDKSGGKVAYTYLHAADLKANQDLVKQAGGGGEDPSADHPRLPPKPEPQTPAPQPTPAAAQPEPAKPEPAKAEDKPKPDKAKGPLFEVGKDFKYTGEAARVWAHPKTVGTGKRPLLVVLHGINPHATKYPQLDPTHVHLGKLAAKLIDDGKVTPLVIAAPTSPSAKPWGGFTLSHFVDEVVKQVKDDGVEIDLDQVSVVGHSGAGCFGGSGLVRIASQGATFDGHALKVFGIADTCIMDVFARGYASGLKNNSTTVIYSVHKGSGGGNSYTKEPAYAHALGASSDSMDFQTGEVSSQIDSYYVGGSPARVSIRIKQGHVQDQLSMWKAAGAYPAKSSDHEAVPLVWTEWALQRFYPATADDQKPAPEPKPEPAQPAPPPRPPVTGGEWADVPPAPPIWEAAPGVDPKDSGAALFADPSTGLFWPVRKSKNRMGRAVPYTGANGKGYGGSGRGNDGRNFLAARPAGSASPDRFHVGIDVWGDFHDIIVAIEAGTIIKFGPFYLGVNRLLVRNDSNGVVINYGEVDAGSLKKWKLKVGDKVQPGQPMADVGKMLHDSMLHFEMYPEGTKDTTPYYRKEGDKGLSRYLNPTAYLLALAKNGR